MKKGKAYIQGVLDTLTVLHFVLPEEQAKTLAHYGSDILTASECKVKHKKGIVKFNESKEKYEFEPNRISLEHLLIVEFKH
jgi:hypothetical protein